MKQIVSMEFGSRLYGTATPASDIDIKSVYIPDAKDILLGRAKGSLSTKRPKGEGEKNYAGEIDEESFSLLKYLGLITEGQTVSLDMLFAPESACTIYTDEWRELQDNRHRLISKRSVAFIGYCMQQAKKYGIKGSRVAAVRSSLDFLKKLNMKGWADHDTGKLGYHSLVIGQFVFMENNEFIKITEQTQQSGTVVRFLEVCGRKLQYTASLKNAIDVLQALFDEYGARAMMAETNLGVDWKALSHAIRIAEQAIELFNTGSVVFPRPNAIELRDIKLGKIPYKELAERIEDLLPQVEAASAASSLPESVDKEWIEDFLIGEYGFEVSKSFQPVG